MIALNQKRFYIQNMQEMRKIEELKGRLGSHDLEIEKVGKVFRVHA